MEVCLKSAGGLQEINGSYPGTVVKNHALTVNISMSSEEISYSCEHRSIQKCL